MNGELEHRREMAISQEGEMAAGRGRASGCLGFSKRVFIGHRQAPSIPRGRIIQVHGWYKPACPQMVGGSLRNFSLCVPSLHTNLLFAKPTFSGVPTLDEWPQLSWNLDFIPGSSYLVCNQRPCPIGRYLQSITLIPPFPRTLFPPPNFTTQCYPHYLID